MTLYHEGLDEIYHSRRGALTESMHVFIGQGLKPAEKNLLSVLEVGFGTGLNVWLSLLHRREDQELWYTAYETHPLDASVWSQLNYGEGKLAASFEWIHQAEWGGFVDIAKDFHLRKLNASINHMVEEHQYDLIYFDAFSPEKQADLWSVEIFLKMYVALKPGGRLVTYCSKSLVRRNMEAAGFKVFKRPGPPGKREMLEAIKTG